MMIKASRLDKKWFIKALMIWAITLLIVTVILSSFRPGTESQDPFITEFLIPMSDGVSLAADLYLPYDFDTMRAYPIIMEYLPYRKDEHRRSRYGVFSYFVQQGYIVARVDIRGTGRSDGMIVPYEYSEQELDDGVEVIDHLSKLRFSNGNIAVLGISWGGFNGLQLATRQHPALKTIVSLMSTDDLYQDDVHFMDGILHVDAYEIGRDLDNAFPAAPDFTLDSAYFHDRFLSEPWFLKYKKQQRDGPFWDRASLNSQYDQLQIPTFLIAGLYDGYRDLVERFFNQTHVPKRAIIGPWNHTWPHTADPGPKVAWRKEVVDWLNHLMIEPEVKGTLTFPELVFYQRDYHPPGGEDTVPGSWKVVPCWSDFERGEMQLYLDAGSDTMVLSCPQSIAYDTLHSRPSDGVEGGGPVMWWGDWPPDQAPFDERSLVYDLRVEDTVSIAGYPKVRLCVRSNREHVNWMVRLNDVAPDGKVTQVTGAGFNSTHLSSASAPEPCPIDSTYCFEIQLHWTTWTFTPGHKIRIAISNAQWPMFWPTPYLDSNLVLTGGESASTLRLPLMPNCMEEGYSWSVVPIDPVLPAFHRMTPGTPSGFAEVNRVEYDSMTQIREVVAVNEWTESFPWGTYDNYESIIHRSQDLNPAETSVDADYRVTIRLSDRTIELITRLEFSSDIDSFYYNYNRRISENGKLLKAVNWQDQFARDFQ